MKAALYVKSDASKREQGVIFDVDAISVIGLSAQEKFYLPAILLVGEKKHILTLWKRFFMFAAELKPKWIALNNVANQQRVSHREKGLL